MWVTPTLHFAGVRRSVDSPTRLLSLLFQNYQCLNAIKSSIDLVMIKVVKLFLAYLELLGIFEKYFTVGETQQQKLAPLLTVGQSGLVLIFLLRRFV